MTAPATQTGTHLIDAKSLSKIFHSGGVLRRGKAVQAVHAVDVSLGRGEALGVVGESGSGKTTLGRLLLGLIPPTEGTITFDGQRVSGASSADWRVLRKRMQIVFQDPYGSLDPRRRIGAQIADGLTIHDIVPPAQTQGRVAALLQRVGLDVSHAQRYPHEFSGGQRQRVGIARALATEPDFLVADEPVSSLDVSIQAQILTLLADLKRDLGLAVLFISHDLPVVRHLCDRVIVMYLGRVMEEGTADGVFSSPAHPYTRALISATPRIRKARRATRILLAGEPPSPSNPPSGCVFRTRCMHAVAACAATVPELRTLAPGRRIACLRAEEIA
jgi:oligopeptide/dipeptide ABC transporter ATP-binding protein